MASLQTNINQVNSDFQKIKTALIDSGVEVADGTRTSEYGEKVREVFDAGKKAKHDAFWDEYQQNGKRSDYMAAFCGVGWTNDTFKPKYDIEVSSAYMLFRNSLIEGDLVEMLDEFGITLDFSNTTNVQQAFQGSKFTRVGEIKVSASQRSTASLFSSNTLVTIDKFDVLDDGLTLFSNTFSGATSLENIIVEGVIGQNGFNVSACPLTHDSLMSIINHLQDKTSATTKPILTIGTTNYNKLTAEEIKIATDKGWEVV